jgi:hypothetical protein
MGTPLPQCPEGTQYSPSMDFSLIETQLGCFPELRQCTQASAIIEPHDTYEELWELGCLPFCSDRYIERLNDKQIEKLTPVERAEYYKIVQAGTMTYDDPNAFHGQGSPCYRAMFLGELPEYAIRPGSPEDRDGSVRSHGHIATDHANQYHDGHFITPESERGALNGGVVFCGTANCHTIGGYQSYQVEDRVVLQETDPNNDCTACHIQKDLMPARLDWHDMSDRTNRKEIVIEHTHLPEGQDEEEICFDCHDNLRGIYDPTRPAQEVVIERTEEANCRRCHVEE